MALIDCLLKAGFSKEESSALRDRAKNARKKNETIQKAFDRILPDIEQELTGNIESIKSQLGIADDIKIQPIPPSVQEQAPETVGQPTVDNAQLQQERQQIENRLSSEPQMSQIEKLELLRRMDEIDQRLSQEPKSIRISITPYAGNRIQRYKHIFDRISALLKRNKVKNTEELLAEMRDDVLFRLQKLLPDVKIKAENVSGMWEGESEYSFAFNIDNIGEANDDVLAAIADVARDFDQDAVHILDHNTSISGNDAIGIEDERGQAIIPVVKLSFSKPITETEFGKLLTDAGILGASLNEKGTEAIIYNSDTYDTTEDAENGIRDFYNKINKLTNDSQREYGTFREISNAKFTNFKRSGAEKNGRTYKWSDSNLQTSEAYRARKNNFSRKASEWARRSLSQKVKNAVIEVSSLLPKIGSFINLNKSLPDYIRLENIGKLFDGAPIKDMSEPVLRAYDILTKIIAKQYKALPIRVYPSNKPIISPENIAQVRSLVDELNKAISNNNLKKVNVIQSQLDELVSWTENRYDNAYRNSGEMMADVDNSNKMVFFTTESGFGDSNVDYTGHPLLNKTLFYTTPTAAVDVNGNPILDANGEEIFIPKQMVYNDVLRVVHDYIAHAASGASFGARGEERAWAAHVASIINEPGFSNAEKLQAIQALTSETRGQNTWVNFVNEYNRDYVNKARELRDRLKREGRNEEATKLQEVLDRNEYTQFSDQKIALLPLEALIGGYPETSKSDTWVQQQAEKHELYVSEQSDTNTKKQSPISDKVKEDFNSAFSEITVEPSPEPEKSTGEKAPKTFIGGFTHEGTVYLNEDVADNETYIHEFAHLHNDWLRENRPKVYQRGIDLVKQELNNSNSEIKEIIDYVKETQPDLQGNDLAEEILTQLRGKRGIDLLNSTKKPKKGGILEWLRQAFDELKRMLGLSKYSDEKVMNMTLDQWVDAANVDLLSGEVLTHAEKAADTVAKAIWGDKVRFQRITEAQAQQRRESSQGNKTYQEKFKAVKKAFGETTAKIIRSEMPFVFDHDIEPFIKYLSNKIPIKSHVAFIVENYASSLQSQYLEEQQLKTETVKKEVGAKELAEKAGYEFFDANTEGKLMSFKKDFREGSVLCTFGNLPYRLTSNFIFWLRKHDADETLPADELTQDNLSQSWKDYLKQKGRLKEDGTYDLTALYPEREDPYGTSSMSVQIDKIGGDISIKNRYNHKVDNPDATLSNNLDTIIKGLHEAVFKETGVEFGDQQQELPGQVISDSDGRLFKIGDVIGEEYYGDGFFTDGFSNGNRRFIFLFDNERIIEGLVFDNKGVMQTYVGSSVAYAKFPFVNAIDSAEFRKNNTTKFNLTIDDKKYYIEIKTNSGKVESIKGDAPVEMRSGSLSNSIYLKEVHLPNVKAIQYGMFMYVPNLRSINLEGVTEIGSNSFNNLPIENLNLPNLEKAGNNVFTHLPWVRELNFPKLQTVGSGFNYNGSLRKLNLPSLVVASMDFLNDNPLLFNVNLPKLQIVGNRSFNDNLEIILLKLPELTHLGDDTLNENHSLRNIYLPNLEMLGALSIRYNQLLGTISLPKLEKIPDLSIYNNPSLQTLDLRKVFVVGEESITDNPRLDTLLMPELVRVGSFSIRRNARLQELLINADHPDGEGEFALNEKSFKLIPNVDKKIIDVMKESIDEEVEEHISDLERMIKDSGFKFQKVKPSAKKGKKSDALLEQLQKTGLAKEVVRLSGEQMAVRLNEIADKLSPKTTSSEQTAQSESEGAAQEQDIQSEFRHVNKQYIQALREQYRLESIPEPEIRKRIDVVNEAISDGTLNRVSDLVVKIHSGQAINEKENAALSFRLFQIKQDLETTLADIKNSKGKDNTLQLQRYLEQSALFDTISESLMAARTETARTLGAGYPVPEIEVLDVPEIVIAKAERIAAKELTDSEKTKLERLTKKAKEAKSKRDAAEKKEETRINEAKKKAADDEIKREASKKRQTKLEKIKEERKEIIEKLRDAIRPNKLNDITRLTAEALWQLSRLAFNYVQEGIVRLPDLVAKIQETFPEITERDIHEALTARNPQVKKRTLSYSQKVFNNLKTQANLLVQIDDALNGIIKEPTKRSVDPEVKKLREKLNTLRRTLLAEKMEQEALDRIYEKIYELENHLANGTSPSTKPRPKTHRSDEFKKAQKRLNELRSIINSRDKIAALTEKMKKVRAGDLDALYELQTEMRMFPFEEPSGDVLKARKELREAREAVRKELERLSGKKDYSSWAEIMDFPRTLLATADMSAVMIQGGLIALSNPEIVWSSYGPALMAAFNEKKALQITEAMTRDAMHEIRLRMGLEFTDRDGPLTAQEDDFKSGLAKRIPGLRDFKVKIKGEEKTIPGVVDFSNRHMTTFLNLLRVAMFDKFYQTHPHASEADLKLFAQFVNETTGRVPQFKIPFYRVPIDLRGGGVNTLLRALLFSPQMVISGIRMVVRYYPGAIMGEILDQVGLGKTEGISIAGRDFKIPFSEFAEAKQARRAIVRQMSRSVLTFGLLSMAAFALGGKIEWDPDEGDFLKITFGRLRINLLSRLTPVLRWFISGLDNDEKRKNPVAHNENKDFFEKTEDFFEYKINPTTGMFFYTLRGKDAINRPFGNPDLPIPYADIPLKTMIPIFVQQAKEIFGYEELPDPVAGGVVIAALNGMGADVYDDPSTAQKYEDFFEKIEYKPKFRFPPKIEHLLPKDKRADFVKYAYKQDFNAMIVNVIDKYKLMNRRPEVAKEVLQDLMSEDGLKGRLTNEYRRLLTKGGSAGEGLYKVDIKPFKE